MGVASELTCDAVQRDQDGKPHRCGAQATWTTHEDGGGRLYLCDRHHDRMKAARGRLRNEQRIAG